MNSVDRVSALRLVDLSKSYTQGKDSLLVLDAVSLSVKKGSSVVITGESGSGKTSLLSVASGLDTPDSGKVYLAEHEYGTLQEGQREKMRARRMGFVFQFHYLLEDLSVLENVMIPLLIQKMNKGDAQKTARAVLEKIGIIEHQNKRPTHLSGGECQRVAVARALAHNPEMLFADEPTGSLDEKNAEDVIKLLFDLVKEQNATLLMVTHNRHFAALADEQYVLSRGKLHKAVRERP